MPGAFVEIAMMIAIIVTLAVTITRSIVTVAVTITRSIVTLAVTITRSNDTGRHGHH
jgi:hypothetical protein